MHCIGETRLPTRRGVPAKIGRELIRFRRGKCREEGTRANCEDAADALQSDLDLAELAAAVSRDGVSNAAGKVLVRYARRRDGRPALDDPHHRVGLGLDLFLP